MALGWKRQYLRYEGYFLNILSIYKQKRSVREFLEVILSLTTITIFSIFALRPTAITIVDLTKEIKNKQENLNILNKKIDNLVKARNIYNAQQVKIGIINSAIPLRAEPEKFIRQIEGLANKDSVKIMGASVNQITLLGTSKAKKKPHGIKPFPPGAREVALSISVSGNYPNLQSFISDSQNLRRPFKIDLLGVNSSKTPKGKIIVAIISGRIPYINNK